MVHTRLIGAAKAANTKPYSQETTIVMHRDEASSDSRGTPHFPVASVAPTAGKSVASLGTANTLPIGTQIHEFKITDVIAIGGFGIVYLAQDLSLGRYVALKEYMPTSLAERTQGITVAVKSAHHADTLNAGLRSLLKVPTTTIDGLIRAMVSGSPARTPCVAKASPRNMPGSHPTRCFGAGNGPRFTRSCAQPCGAGCAQVPAKAG